MEGVDVEVDEVASPLAVHALVVKHRPRPQHRALVVECIEQQPRHGAAVHRRGDGVPLERETLLHGNRHGVPA
jgi:hypothetical protein